MSYRDVLKGMTDAALTNEQRETVVARQESRCFYCDEFVARAFIFDHFMPRSRWR